MVRDPTVPEDCRLRLRRSLRLAAVEEVLDDVADILLRLHQGTRRSAAGIRLADKYAEGLLRGLVGLLCWADPPPDGPAAEARRLEGIEGRLQGLRKQLKATAKQLAAETTRPLRAWSLDRTERLLERALKALADMMIRPPSAALAGRPGAAAVAATGLAVVSPVTRRSAPRRALVVRR